MTPPKVAIVDHSLGNLYSVERACEHAGLEARITADARDIDAADVLILPGVGAFGDAMKTLTERELVEPIVAFAESGRTTVGICLGLHLFMEQSDEFGEHKGLGLIQGKVRRFFAAPPPSGQRTPRVPQVGWNRIKEAGAPGRWRSTPLEEVADGAFMYFVHSYYIEPEAKADILSSTTYEGFDYCSAVSRGNVFGLQFHPERSGLMGLKVYEYIARSERGSDDRQ